MDGFVVHAHLRHDILLEIIQQVVVPAIEAELVDRGMDNPTELLSRLIGSDPPTQPKAKNNHHGE